MKPKHKSNVMYYCYFFYYDTARQVDNMAFLFTAPPLRVDDSRLTRRLVNELAIYNFH